MIAGEESQGGLVVLKQYIVDAFTDQVFKGNPAAVIVLESWISDALMLNLAKENNLSETAFVVNTGSGYHLRWFTPGGEIDLCGHATLATAYVIHRFIQPQLNKIRFQTLSGELVVTCADDGFTMDFPAFELTRVDVTEAMCKAIGVMPLEAYKGRDLVLVVEDEAQVRSMVVDEEAISSLDGLLVHVTARGQPVDCVTRSFGPKLGIAEDPVCGSGHCHVIPMWAMKSNQEEYVAIQASARGGTLWCKIKEDRVIIKGQAVLYAIADLYVTR